MCNTEVKSRDLNQTAVFKFKVKLCWALLLFTGAGPEGIGTQYPKQQWWQALGEAACHEAEIQ